MTQLEPVLIPKLTDSSNRFQPLLFVARQTVGLAMVLVGVAFIAAIASQGPSGGDSSQLLELIVEALRWLTMTPEAALGALGLVAGGILAISLATPVIDRVTEAEVSNYRNRHVVLSLMSSTSVVIALMVVLRLTTSTTVEVVRDSFGLSLVVVAFAMTTACFAQLRQRHTILERELAGRAARELARRTQELEEAWDRGWQGLRPDADLRPWRANGAAIGVLNLAGFSVTLAAVLVGRLVGTNGGVWTVRVLVITSILWCYFYVAPVIVIGDAVRQLRSLPRAWVRFSTIAYVILFLLLISLLLLVVLVSFPLHISLPVLVPVLLAAATLCGCVRLPPLCPSRRLWTPWGISTEFVIDLAAQREGRRRKAVNKRICDLEAIHRDR